jgi:hypothetical protein
MMAARRLFSLILVAITAGSVSATANAEGLGQPQGKVILSISGNIGKANNGDTADFDLKMLEALGIQSLSTATSLTDGPQEFSGVPLRKILAAVDARGKTVEAVALNDYTYDIDIEDFSRFPVILATRMNGRALRVRDKGPLWIVYPLDEFTEMEQVQIERRMVWQLRQLIVK